MTIKGMKKISVAMAMIMIGTAVIGCGSSNAGTTASNASNEGTTETSAKTVNVGVIKLLSHPALDAAQNGFVDGLKEAGYVEGENIKFDLNDAQGEKTNCQTIANKLVNNNSDLILAIGTDAALAAANSTKDIPILLTAVTDPVGAKIVASMEAPGGNVSGTSDLNPFKEQMELLLEILPEAKTVGMLYSSNEMNSKVQVDAATAEAKALGLNVEKATVSSTNEIKQVVQGLAKKVDVIYVPTDNLLAKAMVSVSNDAIEAGIPVIVGEENLVENGGLATIGINYYELGKQTAAQAVKILKGEATPDTLPIEIANVSDVVTINEKTAKALGIKFPQSVLDKIKK